MHLLRRLLYAIFSLWVAASIAFLLIHAAPGGPAIALAGEYGAPGYLEDVARIYGLDRPLGQIYRDWLLRLLRGDLGYSYRHQIPVAALIAERLPVTLGLMLPAIMLSGLFGVGLGMVSVAKPGKPGRGMVAAMAALHAVPNYLVAQLLIMLLSLGVGLFPVQGLTDARAPGGFWDMAYHLVLPVISLALHQFTFITLLTRACVGQEMEKPYAIAAFAKGLSIGQVKFRHALPNALLPLFTLFGVRIGAFLAGSVVVETVFALPGLGRLAVSAAISRDHPVVIGIVLIGCAAILLANLVVDIGLRRLDPRMAERWV